MMSEIDIENFRAALIKLGPVRVQPYRGDEKLREIPVPTGKKRWQAVLTVVSKLDWTRCELLDRSGGLIGLVEAQEREQAPSLGELDGREAQLLAILIKAQQSALANRTAETQAALTACTTAVRMLTEAVGALANVQRMTLDVQAQAYQAAAQIQQPGPEGSEEGGMMSTKLLEQMAPMILAKLLAPGAPAPAPNGTNGANK